jgi:hypothetical protein
MKTLTNILLSVFVFTLLGCEEVILEDDSQTLVDDNISIHNGALPVLKSPVGTYVDLSEYLYPQDLTEGKTLYFQKVFEYVQTSSNSFTKAPDLFQRSYTKHIDRDVVTVVEYKDAQERVKDVIYRYKIISTKDKKTPKEYPIRVAKNSVVSDISINRVQELCVVAYIGSIDLSTTKYLPLYVRNDLLNNQLKTEDNKFLPQQFSFDNILHIYCGTSDNHTTDTYYSKKYGRVLRLQKDIDQNILKVEVTDVLSLKND